MYVLIQAIERHTRNCDSCLHVSHCASVVNCDFVEAGGKARPVDKAKGEVRLGEGRCQCCRSKRMGIAKNEQRVTGKCLTITTLDMS